MGPTNERKVKVGVVKNDDLIDPIPLEIESSSNALDDSSMARSGRRRRDKTYEDSLSSPQG